MTLAQTSARSHAAPRRRSRAPAAPSIGCIAVCAALLGADGTAFAQAITAPAAQSITHNRDDAPQVFSEVVWQLTSGADAGGYTAQWSCGPFHHSVKGTLKADTKLAIRVVASDGLAGWTATVPDDQTDFVGGDETATVAARSLATGDGQVGLTVTFLNNDFSTLAAGSYTLTVTGTITAN